MSGNGSTEASGDGVSQTPTLHLGYMIAIVVVGSLVVILMGIVMMVLVVRRVRRWKQGRRGEWTIPQVDYPYEGKEGLTTGITNAMYAYDGNILEGADFDEDEKIPGRHSLPQNISTGNELERSYAYAYASASEHQIAVTKRGISFEGESAPQEEFGSPVREPQSYNWAAKEQSSSRYVRDRAFMVPAMEEKALYAQIVDIRIKEIPRNCVVLEDFLGTGNFGTVREGVLTDQQKRTKVAVKTLKEGSGEGDRVKFLQEATIMGQFRHPNVVKLHGVVTEDEPVLIVLELLAKGDLQNYLASQKYESKLLVDDHTLLSYCRQVASGMVYLSSKAFVHRDLAARNVLLSDGGLCKIADFGLTRDLMDEDYYVSHGGKIPVKWTAPEAIHYRKYSSASDVWSYGVLLFEIWSIGCKPYQEIPIMEVLVKIEEGYRLPPPPGTPRAIYELMINTWDPDYSERPSFDDISQMLSLPDSMILESAPTGDESAVLGADLSHGQQLYTDLQHKYIPL